MALCTKSWLTSLNVQVINHDVFKHTGISWEWGIVFVEAVLFFLGAETWKWAKRVFFRRRAAKMGQRPEDLEKRAFGGFIESDNGTGNARYTGREGQGGTEHEKI